MPSWLSRLLPASLHPHFMATAPLDAWARMLLLPPARIGVRYWARLVANLAVSAMITALTLPERVLLWPVLLIAGWRSGHRLEHKPGTVVVLGYFRSGTTHLHNLLACDPRFTTPRWSEVLVPQGGPLTWVFFRIFLVAFLGTRRPQDDMAFGPEWPGEDDFALNNWVAASSLPGRFILPRKHEFYSRFHFLEGLSRGEMSRWRRFQWAFLWKISKQSRGRRILLKSPSHTARVGAMLELFDSASRPGAVKFVHISRTPAPVVRSNVAMAQRMVVYGLQDAPPEEETRRRVVEEYGRTERCFLTSKERVPAGDVAMVRYEDLVADPVGELERVYDELGLGWDAIVKERVVTYLDSVRDYKSAGEKGKEKRPGGAEPAAPAGLEWLIPAFGHDRPARPKVTLSAAGVSTEDLGRRRRWAARVAAVTAILVGAAWLGFGIATGNRSDWMVWLVGVATGYATIRTAGVGSVRLGLWSAALTLVVFFGVEFAATRIIYYRGNPGPTAWEMWDATQKEIRSGSTVPWLVFGVLSAFRFASRRHGAIPGR